MLLEQETFEKYGYWPKDLCGKSGKRVTVQCDYCLDIIEKQYSSFITKFNNVTKKDCCKKCRSLKYSESMLSKYGVSSIFDLPENRQKLTKHGECGTTLHTRWRAMIKRCYCKGDWGYRLYGQRGIVVCDEWKDYRNFKSWAISNGYKEGLTIERKNPDKNYCPENCEWITKSENSRRVTSYRKRERIDLLNRISYLESKLIENNIEF